MKVKWRAYLALFLLVAGTACFFFYQNFSFVGQTTSPSVQSNSASPSPVHPQVLLTADKLNSIRAALRKSATLQKYLEVVNGYAASFGPAEPPIYVPSKGIYMMKGLNPNKMADYKDNLPIDFCNWAITTAASNGDPVCERVPVPPPAPGYYQVGSVTNNTYLLEEVAFAIQNLVVAYEFATDPAQKAKYLEQTNKWVSAVVGTNDSEGVFHPGYYGWDEQFLDKVNGTPLTSTWQPDPDTYPLNWGVNFIPDLATQQLMLSLSMVYDWAYDDLLNSYPNTKTNLETSIHYHANLTYLVAGPGINGNFVWWKASYMNNHNFTDFSTLALAGTALLGEDPDASKWLSLAQQNVQILEGYTPAVPDSHFNLSGGMPAFTYLSPDGATPEGVNYGSAGMNSLLITADLLKTTQGIDIIQSSVPGSYDFWSNAAEFQIYHTTPSGDAWANKNVYFGFNDVNWWPYYGPNVLLRHLASSFGNKEVQSYADLLENPSYYPASSGGAQWEAILWYDPSLASTDFVGDFPLFKIFEQYGEAVSRSDWTDSTGKIDENASVVLYRSGPYAGRQIPYQLFNPDPNLGNASYFVTSGHIASDAGSIAIFGGGADLLDPGGYINQKMTRSQNTLIFSCTSGSAQCYDDPQLGPIIGQLGENPEPNIGSGINVKQVFLSTQQICTYNPTAYWNALVTLNKTYNLRLNETPNPISDTCSLPSVYNSDPKTPSRLQEYCQNLKYQNTDSYQQLCEFFPKLKYISENGKWVIPSSQKGGVDYVVEDATAAYDPVAVGMRSYIRHLVYLRNYNVLLAITNVTLSAPRTMELLYHTVNSSRGPVIISSRPGDILVDASQGNATFMMHFFDTNATASSLHLCVGQLVTADNKTECISDETKTLGTLVLTSTGSSWQDVAAFAWAGSVYTAPAGVPAGVTYKSISPTASTPRQYSFTITPPTGLAIVVTVIPDEFAVQIK